MLEKAKLRNDYIISSEDALFTPLGYEKLRDVDPGEAVFIDKHGELFSQQCSDNPQKDHVFLSMFIFQDQILK